ncbi:hypothetical protein D3C73_1271090 [compost metagenome]
MSELAGFSLDVAGKLKRNLLKRPCADPARNGRPYGFKIEIGARPSPTARRFERPFAIVIDFARHGRQAHTFVQGAGQIAWPKLSKIKQALFSP